MPGRFALRGNIVNTPTIERVVNQKPQRAQEKGAPVHIISHIDASEHIIESFANQEIYSSLNASSPSWVTR